MTPRVVLILLALGGAVGSGLLYRQRRGLERQLDTVIEARTSAASGAGDALLTIEVDRIRLALEQARALPARTAEPHLALAVSDGALTLERGDIVLRSATVVAGVPRGIHKVLSIEPKVITLGGGITIVPGNPTDSTLAPRSIRVPKADFDAIRPNLKVGQSAYFF